MLHPALAAEHEAEHRIGYTDALRRRTAQEGEASAGAVVGEAVAGGVDVLVTGDQELLKARNLPVKIASPRQLWDLMRRAR